MDGGSPNPADPPVYGPAVPPGTQGPNVGDDTVHTVQDDGPASGSSEVKESTSKEVMSPKVKGTTSVDDLMSMMKGQMECSNNSRHKSTS